MASSNATSAVSPDLSAVALRIRTALQDKGRSDLADLLDEQMGFVRNLKPLVVVAGETKRGKSAFINALVGRADLSPSGRTAVTNAFIRFAYAERDRVEIQTTGQGMISAEVADLPAWATENGNPGNERGVVSIDVRVPSPYLADILIADTPGVGGLHAVHAEVTLEALKRADALVFVVDASSPLTEPELTFLRRAAARIEHIAIVMSKRDRYSGWQEILAEDADLVKTYAPELQRGPVFPVSSTDALVWLDDPMGRERSGFAQVDDLIRGQLIPRGHQLGESNLARGCISALDELDRTLALREVVDNTPSMRAALDDAHHQLDAAKDAGAQWRRALGEAFNRVGDETADKVHIEMAAIRRNYTDTIRQRKVRNPDDLATRLLADIAAKASQLDAEATDTLVAAVTPIAEALNEGTLFAGLVDVRTITPDTREFIVPLPSRQRERLLDRLKTAQTFTSGESLVSRSWGTIAGLFSDASGIMGLAPVDPTGGLLSIPIAALFASLMRKGTKAAELQKDLNGWVIDQISDASHRLTTDSRRALAAARQEITATLDRQLATREQELRRLVDEAEKASSRTEKEQQDEAARRQRWTTWLTNERDRLRTILERLRAPASAISDH